ncbi:MAG TPA: DHA2 family efflux MFS transporter permease subunit [Caulobacteraceae bacterium]|jgi:DHA2 family multidrug resistance protein|nr:DHA2 family efflux MFS transporter permease subunit [Caulobacteraceae bacterium]
MATAKDFENRVPITVGLMLATVMNSLDTTIANVALPHMAGSVSASQDQITWVLTSYIIASAIMTPLSGWLSTRVGRKLTFLVSIAGFTVASMLCGISSNLAEIVVFRLLQGLCGAALIPLSQAVVLDIYPPSQVGQVMAIWGAGAILGPIFGPVLGGWLTDNFSWRWVFFINLPIGILAFAAVWFFMSKDRGGTSRPFDFLGFGALTVFIGGLQLMLDRGPTVDWFSSREVWVEAICAALGLYVFLVQTLTARHPFFDRKLALDRNFLTCNVFGFFIGLFLFSTMALLPPVMQGLMGYSVFGAGVVMMPRGLGSFAAMFIVGRLVGRIDTRLILAVGLGLCSLSLFQMTHFDLGMDAKPFVTSGIIQGLGIGLLFVPLSVTAFATLTPELRSEGTSVYTLVRNLGSSVGISVMQALYTQQTAVSHADMAAQVQPGNPVGPLSGGGAGGGSVLDALNGEITRQAAMVGLIDVFKLMLLLTLAVAPLLLIMRKPKAAAASPAEIAVD